MLLSNEQILQIFKNLTQNIEVVTSAYTGLGKTKYIKQEAKNKKIPCCELNISATYDNVALSKILEDSLKPTPTLYKFNLNFLTDTDYFHELLFSMAVFKLVYNEESIIVIPDHSFVYIEVANTFREELYNSLSLLKYLHTKNLDQFRIGNLIKRKNLVYVCNYLYLLKKGEIDSKDLSFASDSKKPLFTDENLYAQLLTEYFLPNCGAFPNYHQLKKFTNVLSKLFQNFEQGMFSTWVMGFYTQEYKASKLDIFSKLRSCLIQNMIETTKEFISKGIDNVKSSQNSMINPNEKEKQNLIDKTIKWENSNHFILIFIKEGDYTSIYKSPDKIPLSMKKVIIADKVILEGKGTLNANSLISKMNEYENKTGVIENFNNCNSSDLISKLLNFFKHYLIREQKCLNLKYDVTDLIRTKIIESENTGYVLTPDNFLKMNLIYLRCISKIPLIIMGETGCGKTSLLKFFVENVLRESFSIIYIHSGITVSDIKTLLEQAKQKAKNFTDRKVWVFFDEFNTSDCMGEIVTILCERKFENEKLPENIIFVGACNPYRIKAEMNFKENVGIKKLSGSQNKSQLVHMVKPLPDKAIEFVWDFGVLKSNEIREYVRSMLIKANLREVNVFTELICFVHEYFQNKEDFSSVSLRDVNRFILLFQWFSKSLAEMKRYQLKKPLEEYKKCKEEVERLKLSVNILPEFLSFIHCYYLRLPTEEDRNTFIKLIAANSKNSELRLNIEHLKKLLRLQELELLSRMNLPENIALNQALMENLFAIVPCIFNKIPIFIFRKPGCSKSLAINIISSTFRGENSMDEYIKTLPEPQIVSFQGSDSCTSAYLN